MSVKSNVTVLYSVFEDNSAVVGGTIFHTNCDVEFNCSIEEIISTSIDLPYSICTSRIEEKRGVSTHDSTYSLDVNLMNISHCKFFNNYATGPSIGDGVGDVVSELFVPKFGGGVMYALLTDVFISHSEFINNTAKNGGGGVVYADIVNISIISSQFINNSVYHGQGGVVFVREQVNIIVTHSNFTNSSASLGGIVSLGRPLYATVEITHSQFTNNKAISGGIIDFGVHNRSLAKITISHSVFVNNVVERFGGVVSVAHGDASSRFYQCISYVHIIQTNFIHNQGKVGGVMYTEDCPTYVNITLSKFIANSCTTKGGVMALLSTKQLNVANNEFTSNTAHSAGIAYIEGGVVSIAHNKFYNNTALDGGVFSIKDHCRAAITYINNSATAGNGGVIVIVSSTMTMAHSEFINNRAKQDGGVLWSDDSDRVEITMLRNKFLHNKAFKKGGVLNILKGILTISNSSFDNNSVGNDGGAIYVSQTDTEIIESIFESNRAEVLTL